MSDNKTLSRQEQIKKSAREAVEEYLDGMYVSDSWLCEFIPDSAYEGDEENGGVTSITDDVLFAANDILKDIREEFIKKNRA